MAAQLGDLGAQALRPSIVPLPLSLGSDWIVSPQRRAWKLAFRAAGRGATVAGALGLLRRVQAWDLEMVPEGHAGIERLEVALERWLQGPRRAALEELWVARDHFLQLRSRLGPPLRFLAEIPGDEKVGGSRVRSAMRWLAPLGAGAGLDVDQAEAALVSALSASMVSFLLGHWGVET